MCVWTSANCNQLLHNLSCTMKNKRCKTSLILTILLTQTSEWIIVWDYKLSVIVCDVDGNGFKMSLCVANLIRSYQPSTFDFEGSIFTQAYNLSFDWFFCNLVLIYVSTKLLVKRDMYRTKIISMLTMSLCCVDALKICSEWWKAHYLLEHFGLHVLPKLQPAE